MKLNRLELIAYGPFSGTVLDFSAERAGLHLVYGPNEAGKSTALRALRNLLFGIPARSPDNFRHPHPRLRIGAELVHSGGQSLAFVRRKGLRKTLRGADDQTPLSDDALAALLGGVDRELFEKMFAIDHHDLVRGGEEIVAGGGRLGQALFAAGAGLIRLQQFQQHLDEAMDALFKPGGSKPRINQTLAQLKETRRNQKNAQLLAKTWKTHHDTLQDSLARQEANGQRLADRRQAYHKLERIHEALPLIARRKEILAALPDLEEVPDLPEDFRERRRRAENALAVATHDAKRAGKNVDDLQARIAPLAVPETLLRQAPLVEALQHDLGSYKKAQQDRPSLEVRRQTLEQQAAATLSEAGLTDPAAHAADLHLTPALFTEIREMCQVHDRLTTRLTSAQQRRREMETDLALLATQRQALPPARDTSALERVLQAAVAEGPLEKQLAETRNAMARGEKRLNDRLKRQSLWSGSLAALTALPLPSRATIERFEALYGVSSRRIERLQEDLSDLTTTRDEITADLQSLESAHRVPTEDDLLSARSLRDSGWELVRRHLEGDSPDERAVIDFIQATARGQTLAEAFESAVARADHFADRLRREAEQVSRKGMLTARRDQAADKHRQASADLAALQKEQDDLERQWRSLWAPPGIRPLPPAEMLSWFVEMEALREKASDLDAEKRRADDLLATIEALKSALIAALAEVADRPGNGSLVELIDRAREETAVHKEHRSKREGIDQSAAQLRKALQKVLVEVEDLEQERRAWQTTWEKTMTRMGLDADTSPGAALAMIESLRQAREQQNEAAVLEKRVGGIDRDAEAFRDRVAQLVARLAPEFQATSSEEACVRLNARLTEARAVHSRRLAMERQLEAAQSELDGARRRLEEARTAIQTLCREARCDDPELLPDIEKRSARRQALRQEKDALESRLRHLGAGATVEAFVAEAAAADPDALVPQMEQTAKDIAALEGERSGLDQTIGTARAELRRMDGRAEAAAHAEEAEHLLAALEADVARYARLKVASALLARTIEQYRDKHQGPLIQRASTLFARMTLNAFSGLRAEYDENGNPVLMGIRSANGALVGVAGMSDGTADQLYLALRLASLERYLDAGEPLPFVVDDILLRFDDDRAAATLEVLAELSPKTQVIFFTHHHHLVALAREALDAETLAVHDIVPPQAASPIN